MSLWNRMMKTLGQPREPMPVPFRALWFIVGAFLIVGIVIGYEWAVFTT